MTRTDPDRAFRAALLSRPCPDHALWQTVPHAVSLGFVHSVVGGGAPSYAEIATDGHRLHARRCAPPRAEAEPDADAPRIRAMLEALKPPRRGLTLSLADLRTMRRTQRELGKRWNAVVDLASGTIFAFYAGPSHREPTSRALAHRERVLGGPRLADAFGYWAPRPGAPACSVRHLLDAVTWTGSLELLYTGVLDPIWLSSTDGARGALVMPCRV